MARPSKRRRTPSISVPAMKAHRTRITPPGSAKGKKKRATKVGGPGFTPSNQWADTWKRMVSGMHTRMPGSGPRMTNVRRRG